MSRSARFAAALLLLLLAVAGGTAGYSLIEGWPLLDSLYMTFITITTVGFGEVHPLSPEGKRFTLFLLIFSVFTAGYSITVLIAYIFEGQILKTVRERRMKRAIRRLRDHHIICGCGDVGRETALEFQRARVRFVVVDRNPGDSELGRDESVLFVQGDAVDDEVLQEAGIERARGLVAALPDDEANVFVTLTARQLNPKLTIVSQAAGERTIRKLLKAGANRVVSPKRIAGRRMASLILRPSVVNFLDVVIGGELAMRIEEVAVEEGSPLAGQNLREAGIGQRTGAIIVGINDAAGRTRINPEETWTLSNVVLQKGDVLIALGNDLQLGRLRGFVKRGK